MFGIAIGAVAVLALMPRHREPHGGTATSPPPARRTGSRRRILLGHSVRGRPIYVTEVGDRRSPRRLLVIGCIHGDEAAGIAIARAVERTAPRSEDVWVVDDLNPDGLARRTRQNAHGVDLNRNFPAGWRVDRMPIAQLAAWMQLRAGWRPSLAKVRGCPRRALSITFTRKE